MFENVFSIRRFTSTYTSICQKSLVVFLTNIKYESIFKYSIFVKRVRYTVIGITG